MFFEREGASNYDVAYHLLLLTDRKFVIGSYDRASGTFDIERLSMDGHDFLDSVRDQGSLEKDQETRGGGGRLYSPPSYAKGFIKKQIEELTDVKL